MDKLTYKRETGTASLQKQDLIHKIETRQAVVGVVGLGYVGLPFAVEKAKVGFQVIGFDRNRQRVSMVNCGENYISDVNDDELLNLSREGLIRATEDFDELRNVDVIVICVPTPLTKNLAPDLQYIEAVTKEIARNLRPGQLISLESTTYPGTTEEVMLPILLESGLEVEYDFFLAHSPERVDPGNKRYTTSNTTKVVGGIGPDSLQVASLFYQQTIQRVVEVSSTKAAELVKVYENTFRAVNIALVNELTMLCDRMDLNVWEVLDAAFTKPFGIMPFYPGPGVGGHCIPLDPHYLEWKAKEYNFNTHFIALAGEINRKMPEFTYNKIVRALNYRGKSVLGSVVLVMGVSYKKNIGDYRESPAIEIIERLLSGGASVKYVDPYISEFKNNGLTMKSETLTADLVRSSDVVVITTEHDGVDYDLIVSNSDCVVDTRNATRYVKSGKENVILL